MELLHAALAGFFLPEVVKIGLSNLQPWSKIGLAVIGAVGVVWLTGDTETWVATDTTTALAASGGAVLLHRLARMLGAIGDVQRKAFLARR